MPLLSYPASLSEASVSYHVVQNGPVKRVCDLTPSRKTGVIMIESSRLQVLLSSGKGL